MVWLSIVWIVTDQSRFYMIIVIGNLTFNIALDSTGIPNFVELEITYTEPAVKKVDTRTGEYVERMK